MFDLSRSRAHPKPRAKGSLQVDLHPLKPVHHGFAITTPTPRMTYVRAASLYLFVYCCDKLQDEPASWMV
jgi:hypothetical protein